MRHSISIVLAFAIFGISSCNNQSQTPEIGQTAIKVGVFDGHGGAQTCVWETVEAIKIDPEMGVRLITTSIKL